VLRAANSFDYGVNMLALRAKTEAGWGLVHAPSQSLSEFLFFRYSKCKSTNRAAWQGKNTRRSEVYAQ